MIIDDDQALSTLWTSALEERGHTVECIADGRLAQRAIFSAASQHYDLILCDLALPGMSGKALLASILPLLKDRVPVVVMSAHPPLVEALDELRHGAFSILPKSSPNTLSDFLVTVAKALEQRALYRSIQRLRDENAELLHKTRLLLAQNEDLSECVRVDPLTKIANRVRLLEDLRVIDAMRMRHGVQFALGIVDIDRFGRFNKVHGIATGDEVLRRVAASLRDACRQCDLVYRFDAYEAETTYRWGGDEFVLVIGASNTNTAAAAMDRIRRQVEAEARGWEEATAGECVTISGGVAADDGEHPRSIDELLQAADDALREAKREGGNCVRPSPPQETGPEGTSVEDEQ